MEKAFKYMTAFADGKGSFEVEEYHRSIGDLRSYCASQGYPLDTPELDHVTNLNEGDVFKLTYTRWTGRYERYIKIFIL